MGLVSRRSALRAGVLSSAVIGGAAMSVPADAALSVPAQAAPAAPGLADGWVSVLDHGAVGDGTTDDTAAIQAALTAARAATPNRSVHFPPARVFRVTDQLTVAGLADAVIAGNGATLALTGATPSVAGAKSVLRLTGCQRVTIENLTVRDTDRTQQYTGVSISSATAVVVRGVLVHNVRWNGIAVFDDPPGKSADVSITNCTTEGTRFGISSNGSDVRITGNHVAMDWYSTEEALRNNGVHPGEASDYFDGIMVLAGSDRTVVSGNTITECGQAGVFTQAVTNLVVADNTVTRCVLRGIEVDGQQKHLARPGEVPEAEKGRAHGVTITGNTVVDCHGHINVLYANDVSVVGNRIHNSRPGRAVTCIAVNQGTQHAVVVGNHCRQAHPSMPAIWAKRPEVVNGRTIPGASDVTIAWNGVAAAVGYSAPAETVIMHRSGASEVTAVGTVKVTGKVIASGGLGVGNFAAASRPGSVVRKMEVFSATGESLGWIPIYDSIT